MLVTVLGLGTMLALRPSTPPEPVEEPVVVMPVVEAPDPKTCFADLAPFLAQEHRGAVLVKDVTYSCTATESTETELIGETHAVRTHWRQRANVFPVASSYVETLRALAKADCTAPEREPSYVSSTIVVAYGDTTTEIPAESPAGVLATTLLETMRDDYAAQRRAQVGALVVEAVGRNSSLPRSPRFNVRIADDKLSIARRGKTLATVTLAPWPDYADVPGTLRYNGAAHPIDLGYWTARISVTFRINCMLYLAGTNAVTDIAEHCGNGLP